MPYVIPVFNINVAFWRSGNAVTNPPDVITIGNLSPGRIVSGEKTEQASNVPVGGLGQSMWLRLPKGTDVQDVKNNVGADICECPYTSGRFYYVAVVDDVGGGFANEHRFAVLVAFAPWPTPFPPVGGFTPIVPPVPPPFLANFTTGGALLTTQTYAAVLMSNRVGGFIVVYNSAIVPTINVGGGPGGVVSGPTFTATFSFGAGQTAHLYSWTLPAVAGLNAYTVATTQLGGAAWTGMMYDQFDHLGVTTSEGTATGAGIPSLPPYTPASPHPFIHMALVVQAVGVAPTYQAPFSVYTSLADVIGGTNVELVVGQYAAGIGGVFPAACAFGGPFGNWGMIQVGWAP
jgi:hypothetical protein